MFGKCISGFAGMAAALAIGLANPAAAAAPATDSSMLELHVSTVGLDITKPADQALLRHRIAVAAAKLCAMVNDGAGPGEDSFNDCFQRTAGETRRQADAQIAALQSKAMVAFIAR